MYDFKTVEQEITKLWEKDKVKEKTLEYEPKKKLFSFLEGPPTANAPPALHHVEVRVFKDLFCRFKYMQGYSVPRKGGWDCHGLPVEVQIEKALKLNSKKEILNYGIEKFNDECKVSVFSYINDWNKLTDKMAFWIDLEKPYITMDNNYIESVWWSLKELYNKKMLYEGHKVVPFCPRCETPLSSHEVALGYKDVNDTTITVKFKLKNENRYILAWTTTPWTLPSNLALAVNSKIDYVVVKEDDEEYILANDLVKKYFKEPNIIKKINGKDLLNLEYEPLFPYFKDLKNSFKVIEGDFVSTEEGTGVVHIAPAFGEEDYNVCKLNNIDFVQPIDERGHFTAEVGEFSGLFVKSADPKIIEYLDERGILVKKEKYLHSYPFCWRCNTPLIYYAMVSWFINVSSIREKLIKNNKKITWVPEHIKEGRFGNWLEGAKDWALSRKKFWGTPLPIWRCDNCKNEIIIGSVKELKEHGENVNENMDLHKPQIDEIKIKCQKCKNLMSRIPDVIDCWYDSGAAPFAQFHYPFENKEMFEKSFSYDFIAEAIDQTRGWFYTLHVLGALLFEKEAYKSVVCAGHVVDEKGEKMSKSKGNVIDPWEVFNTMGVDATRLQFCINEPGDQKRFSINLVNQQVMPFLTILWNCYQYSKDLNTMTKTNLQIEDKWILAKTNILIEQLTSDLEKHHYNKCLTLLISFVNEDLSRTYIKLIRDRVDDKDPTLGYVFNYVFERLTKLLAPFAPYISDYLYQNIEKKSVHLSSWPKVDKKLVDPKLIEAMEKSQKIIQTILHEREKVGLGVRWPLAKVTIFENEEVVNLCEDIIKTQTNIKKIKVISDSHEWTNVKNAVETDWVKLAVDTELTSELENEGFAREITRLIQDLRKKAGLKKENKINAYVDVSMDLGGFTENIKEKIGAVKLVLGNPGNNTEFSVNKVIRGQNVEIFVEVL